MYVLIVKFITYFFTFFQTRYDIIQPFIFQPDLSYKIEIDDTRIEYVKVTKFLGVLIDNNLSWKAHTSHITKIVSKYNGIIRKVRIYLNQDSLHTLYNTLVLPYLSYCALVWGDKNNANLESLFLLQKKNKNNQNMYKFVVVRTHHSAFHVTRKTKNYTYQLAVHMYRYHYDLLPPKSP